MKIETITNACCLYTAEDHRLLADPWLTNGAFEGSWYHTNGAIKRGIDPSSIDFLYISHLHPDHYDPATLAHFRKDIPVIILDRQPNFLERKLKEIGFTNFKKIKDGETSRIGFFEVTMYGPFSKHPFDDSEVGNLIDSAIVIRHGDCVVLNANDNTPTPKTAKMLREKHGPFTRAQLKFALAGPYPSCFRNLDHGGKLAEKEKLIARQQKAMLKVASILEAEVVESFAGNYCLAGSLAWKNPYLAVPDLDLNDVPEGAPYSYELEQNYPSVEELVDLCHQARSCLWTKQNQFSFFVNYKVGIELAPGYFFTIDFSNPVGEASHGSRAQLNCFLDTRLLKATLVGKSHWNLAEVGCHIDFDRNPNIYNPDISTMMCFFHLPRGVK